MFLSRRTRPTALPAFGCHGCTATALPEHLTADRPTEWRRLFASRQPQPDPAVCRPVLQGGMRFVTVLVLLLAAATAHGSTCADRPSWKDKFGSDCNIYIAHGRCKDGTITDKQTKAEMAAWGSPPPYEACCACGGGTRVECGPGFVEAGTGGWSNTYTGWNTQNSFHNGPGGAAGFAECQTRCADRKECVAFFEYKPLGNTASDKHCYMFTETTGDATKWPGTGISCRKPSA